MYSVPHFYVHPITLYTAVLVYSVPYFNGQTIVDYVSLSSVLIYTLSTCPPKNIIYIYIMDGRVTFWQQQQVILGGGEREKYQCVLDCLSSFWIWMWYKNWYFCITLVELHHTVTTMRVSYHTCRYNGSNMYMYYISYTNIPSSHA